MLIASAIGSQSAGAQSSAATFTISAGDASLTRTGSGSIPFTLTSVNGFAGSIVVGCDAPVVPAGVHIPTCGGGPVRLYTLAADQTLTGALTLNAYGAPVPAAIRPANNPLLAVLFLVALLSGLRLRRRSARWLPLALLVAGIVPFSSILGCGTAPQGFTPGVYAYTVTAALYRSPAPLERGVNATVTIH